MNPERAARLARWWVALYTRGLPRPIAERRASEISGDIADQIEFERSAGVGERRIAFALLSRSARGALADLSWRRERLGGRRRRRPLLRAAAAVLCVTGLLLLIPLVATLLSDDVVWTLADFVAAGALLGGAGFLLALLWQASYGVAYKLGAAAALGSCLMLVWASLAVGLIGAEGDTADRMYAGVLAVGVIGAALARLRPRGMARAMLAMALAQMLVAGIAILTGEHQAPTTSTVEILGVNSLFATFFLAAASLFSRAS